MHQIRGNKNKINKALFCGACFIPNPPNAVQRLIFSKAHHVHRHSILIIRLDMLLFLKVNRHFWGAATVSKVVNALRVAQEQRISLVMTFFITCVDIAPVDQ
ncbi:hypothetical protein PHMEG_00037776 [Phytophthora megakarya]|uniref:Uncharacterized protein n=1 Tax=Phytophthora megakarya TaxID=4795 RepID=A0A225UKA3_9STRA|nr:hypothetical protein PHMEG_00037776 [Phytophthora megakarya]